MCRRENDDLLMHVAQKASNDDMTELPKLGTFETLLQSHFNSDGYIPGSLLFLDIDNLGQLNNTYGHPTADKVIKTVGSTIKSGVRQSDIVCRRSGDEFLVYLCRATEGQAQMVVHRLQDRLALSTKQNQEKIPHFSVSIGVAKCQGNYDLAVYPAEEALRCTKQQKGQVVVYQPDMHFLRSVAQPIHA